MPGSGQRDGFGADLRGDVGEFLFRAPAGQVHPACILHEALAVLVDGNGDVALCGGFAGDRDARWRGLGKQGNRQRASQCEQQQVAHNILPL